MALVDPLLASGGGVDDGLVADFEDGLVLGLEVLGDAFDIGEFAVEVFELVDHVGAPETFLLEVVDKDRVEDGEVATEVTLHKQVGVVGLDTWSGAHDVRDGGGRRDGEDVGIAHAILGDAFADGTPVHFAATGNFDLHSPFVFEEIDGILWQDAAVPLGAFVGIVGATLAGELAAGAVGVVADRFHELVVEINGRFGGELEVLLEERILETHDAESDGTVTTVGGLGGIGRVEINVDDVVERADGHGDSLAEHVVIEHAVLRDVRVENDGAEVADSRFLIGGVESDLGAEVTGVNDAGVVLRAAEVAGIFEGDPRVTGFEDHLEHLFPEIDGLDLAGPDLAFLGHRFVFGVALLEGLAVEIVEIGAFVGAEKSPMLAGLHALHEEVGNPVGGIHVVRAATFVTDIHTELEEVLDVVVPGLEVGAAGAATLAALVDSDELVVVELEERNDALGLSVGALNVTPGSANGGPGSTQSPGPFAEEGILGDAAMHDGLDGVIYLVEVAAGELGMESSGVEKRRRGGTEAAAFIEIVKADDPVFGVRFLGLEETHGDTHPEELRSLHAAGLGAGLVDVEVTIVESLNAEEIEVEVGGRIEGVGETVEVVFLEDVRRDAFDLDAVLEVGFEVFLVSLLEGFDSVGLDVPGQDFFVNV